MTPLVGERAAEVGADPVSQNRVKRPSASTPRNRKREREREREREGRRRKKSCGFRGCLLSCPKSLNLGRHTERYHTFLKSSLFPEKWGDFHEVILQWDSRSIDTAPLKFNANCGPFFWGARGNRRGGGDLGEEEGLGGSARACCGGAGRPPRRHGGVSKA